MVKGQRSWANKTDLPKEDEYLDEPTELFECKYCLSVTLNKDQICDLCRGEKVE